MRYETRQIVNNIVFVIFVGAAINLCTLALFGLRSASRRAELHRATLTNSCSGITLQGVNSSGSLTNNNDFPVRIEEYRIRGDAGEVSERSFELQPGQVEHMEIRSSHVFCIYNMSGQKIGLLRPPKEQE